MLGGISIGHFSGTDTGVTVLYCGPGGALGSVDVRGGEQRSSPCPYRKNEGEECSGGAADRGGQCCGKEPTARDKARHTPQPSQARKLRGGDIGG